MCDIVAAGHLRSKASRHHRIVSIQEAQDIKALQKTRQILQPKSCLSHHRPYEYYDLTCEKVACIDCLLKDHAGMIITNISILSSPIIHWCCYPGHQTSPISDPALMDQMAERVRGLLSRLEARMTEMVEAEQSLSRLVQELDECTEVVLRRIGEEFGKLRQMLDRRQTELETKTRELRKSKRFMLEEQIDRLSVLRSNLCLLCECAGEVQAQLSKSKSEPGSESKGEGERAGGGGKEDGRSSRNMDTQRVWMCVFWRCHSAGL